MAVTLGQGIAPQPSDLGDIGAEFLDPRVAEENLQRTARVGLLGLNQAAVDPGMHRPGMHPPARQRRPEGYTSRPANTAGVRFSFLDRPIQCPSGLPT